MQAQAVIERSTQGHPAPTTKSRFEVPLGRDGVLAFGPSWDFAWTWDEGLRVVGSAQLRWAALGIRSTVLLGRVAVEIQPSLTIANDGEDEILIGLRFADAAFGGCGQIRARLIDRLNDAIRGKSAPLPWTFGDTLAKWLALPATFDALKAVGLVVPPRRVTVLPEVIALAASFADSEPVAFESLRQGEER